MGSPPGPKPVVGPGPAPGPRSDVAPKLDTRVYRLTLEQSLAWWSDDDVERGFMRAQVREVCRKRVAESAHQSFIQVEDARGRPLARVRRPKPRGPRKPRG